MGREIRRQQSYSPDRKFLIALQFWDGDKAQAMNLARYLADLEPRHSDVADFLFVSRFDCKHDQPTVDHVSRKFNTRTFTSRRRGVGWPDGCNDLWFSVMEWLNSMINAKKILPYKAVFTTEADNCPIQRDWAPKLSALWDKANEKSPVVMAGALVDPGPHINGNAFMSCRPDFLHWIARRIGGVRPGVGWDWILAPEFRRLGWANLTQVKSIYHTPTFSKEQFDDMRKNDWIWIHGCKDDSLIRHGRELFKV